MIYQTKEEIAARYGARIGGFPKGRFNVDDASRHSDDAYKYEFGYIKGTCAYAIMMKKKGGLITLAEATGLRASYGHGVWKLDSPLDPAKNTLELAELLDSIKDISYQYTAVPTDRFQSTLISAHQALRRQLVIYHPTWRPDLSLVAANPL